MEVTTDGHVHPEDAGELLTVQELIAAGTETIELPKLSARRGKRTTVTIGLISRAEYIAMLPVALPGQESWPEGERQQRLVEALTTMPAEERTAWNRSWAAVPFKLCAVAVLNPPMTEQQARLLGDEADWLAAKILAFSGIVESQITVPAGETAPPATTEEAGAVAS